MPTTTWGCCIRKRRRRTGFGKLSKAVSKQGIRRSECELAIALSDAGDYETARNHFLNSLEINPNYADAYFFYALLLVELNDLEEAKTTSIR